MKKVIPIVALFVCALFFSNTAIAARGTEKNINSNVKKGAINSNQSLLPKPTGKKIVQQKPQQRQKVSTQDRKQSFDQFRAKQQKAQENKTAQEIIAEKTTELTLRSTEKRSRNAQELNKTKAKQREEVNERNASLKTSSKQTVTNRGRN